jgi:hypothetical protein
MIGLIVAIESFVARNWLDFSDPVSLSWRFSVQTVQADAPGCDLLCLGDSLVKHGLIPSVVEGGSGLRTVNLSAARCPTLMTYFLFRRALEAGSHPAAILINAKPAVLLGGLDFNLRYWQEVLSSRDGLELAAISRKGNFLARALLGRLLPSFRSRLEIQSNLMAALRGETDRLHGINRMLWRNWTVNEGANVAHEDPGYQGELPSDVAENLHPDVFHIDRTNAEGLKRLLKLAARRDIRVFYLLTPLTPALQNRRDQSGAEAKYEQMVRSIQAKYPQVMTVLDARRAGYPPRLFVDATHLNGRGAIALSRAVAAAVDAELIGPEASSAGPARWIELPPPPDRFPGLEVTLEDVEESKRIVQGASTLRR